VQQVDVDPKILLANNPRAESVRGNNDGNVGQRSGEPGRFVTDLPGIEDEARPGIKDYGPFSSTAAITARQDARAMPAGEQSLGHQDHHWSLASSPHAQIAHTYYRAVQTPGFEPPATI